MRSGWSEHALVQMDALVLRKVVQAVDDGATLASLACCSRLLRQLVSDERQIVGEYHGHQEAPPDTASWASRQWRLAAAHGGVQRGNSLGFSVACCSTAPIQVLCRWTLQGGASEAGGGSWPSGSEPCSCNTSGSIPPVRVLPLPCCPAAALLLPCCCPAAALLLNCC